MCCCVATDVTERSQYAAEILHLANFDPLTQLPNRRLFHDRIHMAIIQARRKSAKFGLLMIDLDRFKPVNDKYGHSVGDLLLGAVAGRMQKCLRESDTLARIGGDEFVAILPMIGDAADAEGVARKLRLSLCQPFKLTDDVTVSIDCSIGVAIYPDHGGDEDSLLKNSDDAMYIAKSQGRTKVYFAGSCANAEDGGSPGSSGNSRDGDPLVWRRAYQCGEKTIDRQHKSIFVLCNSIIRAAENGGASLDQLPEMLDKLIDEMVAHCRYEESVLSRYAYPGLDTLNQKHQALFERARGLSRRFLAREAQVGEVIASIRRGIAQHMLTEDHEFYTFLKKMLQQQDQTDPA
jgi:diguanylate cyclase (GGDEF)-like protein/hemerythrin-like metal-binding protein